MGYEYPPSQHILRNGPLQEGSHYYAEGIAFFANRHIKRLQCTFEVAYTQQCEVIVVCYPSMDVNFDKDWLNDCYKIVGRDVQSGKNIVVENLFARQWLETFSKSRSLTMIYQASCFKVTVPIHQLSDQITKYPSHFEITGIEFPKWFDPNDKHYDAERGGRISFPLDENGEHELALLFRRTVEQREYDNQSTGRLAVPSECVPDGWSAADVADVWCALISLAIGRDVQWISWFLPLDFRTYQAQVWQTKRIKAAAKLYPYIAKHLLTKDAFQELQDFVRKSLGASIILTSN